MHFRTSMNTQDINGRAVRGRRYLMATLAVLFGGMLIMADASEAFAQRRGGRSGGRSSVSRGRSGGSRSISRGSRSRSFSRGSSNRSFSRGSRGRSSFNRSSRGSSIRRSNRGSSFNRGSRGNFRSGSRGSSIRRSSPRSSFNRGTRRSTPSFNRGSRNGISSNRFGTRSINRGNSSVNRSTRNGFSSSNRSGNRSIQRLNRGNSTRSGNRNGFTRSTRRGSTFGNSRGTSRRGSSTFNRGTSRRSNRFFGNSRNGNRSFNRGSNRGFNRGSNRGGSTRFNRGSSQRFNNRGFGNTRFGRRGVNRGFNRGFNNNRFVFNRGFGRRFGFGRAGFGFRNRFVGANRFFYRNFGFPGFGRRYFGFWNDFGFCRFRTNNIFFGHNFFRPYPFSAFGLGVGFGFYDGCFAAPIDYYPAYYPAWGSPVFVDNDFIIEEEIDFDDLDDDDIIAVAPADAYTYVQGDNVVNNVNNTGTTYRDFTPTDPLAIKMQQAGQYFDNGDYGRAARDFEAIARQDPNNADAWLAYGLARFATGDYNQSADGIRRGIELFPDVVNTVFDVRDRYKNVDDFGSQIQRLEQAVEANRNDADAHLTLGFVYHFTGQREWAKQVFDYLESISPQDQHLARVFRNAKPLPDNAQQLDRSTLQQQLDNNASAQQATYNTGSSFGNSYDDGYDGSIQSMTPVNNGGSITSSGRYTDGDTLYIDATQPTAQRRTPVNVRPNPPANARQIRVFEGSVSEDSKGAPRRLLTIDDIIIECKDVEDDPWRADLDIQVGNYLTKYRDLKLGMRVSVRGASGTLYWLTLTSANEDQERVMFTLQE